MCQIRQKYRGWHQWRYVAGQLKSSGTPWTSASHTFSTTTTGLLRYLSFQSTLQVVLQSGHFIFSWVPRSCLVKQSIFGKVRCSTKSSFVDNLLNPQVNSSSMVACTLQHLVPFYQSRMCSGGIFKKVPVQYQLSFIYKIHWHGAHTVELSEALLDLSTRHKTLMKKVWRINGRNSGT